ncbi:MAG: tRNA (adenosine(37)-N6)-threonylcarbamoyltransferase complex ATPase subunit type 1 TsaE [Candidatus Omnitrophota bacterium]
MKVVKPLLKIITNSSEETMEFGEKIAKILKPNSVVALSGQLGSGKTTLVKGIAAGLGIPREQVISPSFTLIREYQGKKLALFHCDLYRLDNLDQIAFLGLDDYFNQGGVLVIEWAKKAAGLLPEDFINIEINRMSREKRTFRISAVGEICQRMIGKLKVAS